MASTFSPTLRLELIGDGDQSGIWGQTTNNNLGALLEQAITGVATISMVDANYTLSNFNGVVDESRNQVITATGALSAQRNIIAPLVEKTYTIRNSTTGGFGVQIIGPSGTGVIVPNGATVLVYCDGTNFLRSLTASAGNFSVNGNFNVTGTTTLTGALTASTATFSGAISSVSPTFTGIPTAPTASSGTNTTQIATTAFVQNVAGTLGTMSTQNANNVAITGGTITGSYGLTAANATNATNATTVTTTIASGATGTTQPIATNNNTIATTAFVRDIIPAGVILMWSGSVASIPAGWLLCNGTSGTPDLRNRFIVGAGSTYTPGNTGGSANTTLPSHTHTFSTSTTAGQGAHEHFYAELGVFLNFGGGSRITSNRDSSGAFTGYRVMDTDGVNLGQHVHTVAGTTASAGSSGTNANLPPYYALAYIMKS